MRRANVQTIIDNRRAARNVLSYASETAMVATKQTVADTI